MRDLYKNLLENDPNGQIQVVDTNLLEPEKASQILQQIEQSAQTTQLTNPQLPYISIVIVGRNDDYGVNFLGRINTFIRHLDRQTTQYKDLFELIVVEYNPLLDRSPLKDVLYRSNNFETRIITVPESLHKTANMPSPVLEFWGKNVGIRRSKGDYVLVCNPDIIFSNEMIDSMAQRNLNQNAVYRTDRYDFHAEGIENHGIEQYLDFAIKHTFQAMLCTGTVKIDPCDSIDQLPSTQQNEYIFTNACGDFILSAKKNFEKAQGLVCENPTSHGHTDSFSLIRLIKVAKLETQFILTKPLCIFHMDHERNNTFVKWNPDIAIAAADWQGWFAKPTWFSEDWGFANEQLPQWSNRE